MVGGYAEYVAVEHDNVALVPEGVRSTRPLSSPARSAPIFNAMRDVGNVKAGETVLVTGSGGGLGTAAVQLARPREHASSRRRLRPTRPSSCANWAPTRWSFTSAANGFFPEVRKLTKWAGVDVVVDNVGNLLFQPIRKSIAVSADAGS
jgi:acryloyl-coenzyme A reductase